MLKGFRKAGESWVGKAVITVMFGMLIVSFAVWGIGDIFRQTGPTYAAQVGNAKITPDALRTAYQAELQRLSRQFRRTITPDQARMLGLERQVLTRLITDAVLDERARALGLAVSDELIARMIREDTSFRGPSGQFDRAVFEDLLRNNGLNETTYVRDQRGAVARLQLAEAITGNLPVPVAAREALHRYTAERRSVAYVMLPAAAAGDIPGATDEQLRAFYDERKASFRSPEYRALTVVALDAAALARPEQLSDADARQRYEQTKARYGSPERRAVQQIIFPNEEEAQGALDKIKAGATFQSVAQERNVDPGALDLGNVTKQELIDKAVAEAAFALAEGATSAPVKGQFGTVLVHVAKVEPERVKPFEEVAEEVRREAAQERARGQIETVHDAIEDARAGARPLADTAREKGLAVLSIPAVDRTGRDKAGQPVALPDREAVLSAAFASDVGVDNEALRLRNGGYVWFDIAGIEPARDKRLEEVRDEVARRWREDQIAQRLSNKAREMVERLEKGEAIEAVATDAGQPVKSVEGLPRGAARDDLATDVVTRIFATPVGKSGSAASGETRAVFKVTAATVPPFVTTTQEAQRLEDQLRTAMSDDLLGQYIAQAQSEIGVTVNQEAVRRAIGGET
jgi:peptidyl-prolyl cis-trans isomerase D